MTTAPPASAALKAQLAQVPTFQGLPDEVLDWFLTNATLSHYAVGDYAWRSKTHIEELAVILDGWIEVLIDTEGRNEVLMNYGPGSITGRLPFSRMKETFASGIAREPSTILRLHRQHFRELENQSYELMERLVGLMTDRVRSQTTTAIQQEKLVSLGKLSAGLAHELNNPSSAIVRAAQQLGKRLEASPETYREIMARRYTPEQVDLTARIFQRALNRDTDQLRTSLMARSNAQMALEDWLLDHNIPNASQLADTLLDCGIEPSDLDEIATAIPDGLTPVIQWLENSLVSACLLYDIEQAAKRISELVGSVKQYTHMDQQADNVHIDFAAGVRSTLVMLGGKVKAKSAQIETDFPKDLPQVCGNPGQLNQVFTNLLDNALDALPDTGGKIRVWAEKGEGDTLRVHFADNGEGIPDDVREKIFEAFFTTKPVGQGTGMGLDIVKRILDVHQAKVDVQSQPGETVFTLTFPAG